MKRIIILMVLAAAALLAQERAPAEQHLRRGVELYDQGDLERSLQAFQDAAGEAPGDALARFNTLTVQAKIRKLQEAEAYLSEHPELEQLTPVQRSDAFHNLGTAYLENAETKEKSGALAQAEPDIRNSIRWLQQSLLANPQNYAAKNNLEIANKLLEKLQQQQSQQQQKGENSQEGNEDQESREQQNDDSQQQKEKDREQNQQDKQQQQQQQQQNQQQRSISPEMAKNLLEAAKEKEKQALKELRAAQAKNKKDRSGKDY